MPSFGDTVKGALKVAGTGYQVVPSASNGIDLTPGNSWANGSYVQVTSGLANAVYLVGIKFSATTGVEEYEIDIATGGSGSEVVVAVIPAEQIANATAVAVQILPTYFMYPIPVAASVRIACRARRSSTALVVNNIKLIYVNQSDLAAIS